jgi:hypothetical protein
MKLDVYKLINNATGSEKYFKSRPDAERYAYLSNYLDYNIIKEER